MATIYSWEFSGRFYGGGTLEEAAQLTQDAWWNAEIAKPGVTMATNFATSGEATNYAHQDSEQANVTWDAGGIPGSSGGALKLLIPASSGSNPGAWRRKMNDSWNSVTDGFLNTKFYVFYQVYLGPGFLRPSNGGGGKKVCIVSAVKIGDENSSSSAQGFEIVNNSGSNGSYNGVLNAYHSINQTFQESKAYGLSLQPALDWGAGIADQQRYSIWNNSNDLSPGNLLWEEGVWISVKFEIQCQTYGGTTGNTMKMWAAWPSDSTWKQIYDATDVALGANDSFYTGGFSGTWFTGYDTGRTTGNGDSWLKVGRVICSTADISLPPPLHYVPTWYTSMADKTWAQPVSNTLSDVYQAGGAGLPASGLFAWSTGITNYSVGSLDFYGGGHTDNDVNSLFRVELRSDSPTWVRKTNPSSNAGGSAGTGVYGDGQPRSSHTWHHMVDVPANGTWLCPLPGTYVSGLNSGRFFNFSEAANNWVARGYQPGTDSSGGPGDANTLGHSYFDQQTGLVWVSASEGAFWTMDPDTYAVTAKSAANSTNYYMTAGLARERRAFVIWHQSSNSIRAYDLDGDSISTPGISGTAPSGASSPGMDWHSPSGRFLVWGHSANRANVFTLKPPSTQATTFSGTYTWASVAPSGSNSITPPAPGSGGADMPTVRVLRHFGGLRKDILVVHHSATSPVSVYKLPVGGV